MSFRQLTREVGWTVRWMIRRRSANAGVPNTVRRVKRTRSEGSAELKLVRRPSGEFGAFEVLSIQSATGRSDCLHQAESRGIRSQNHGDSGRSLPAVGARDTTVS
jgi:hypothetical protein